MKYLSRLLECTVFTIWAIGALEWGFICLILSIPDYILFEEVRPLDWWMHITLETITGEAL